jgi:hypothetical protein
MTTNSGQPWDGPAFDAAVSNWEGKWIQNKDVFPVVPSGDTVAISRTLYSKYGRLAACPTGMQFTSYLRRD